MPKDMPPPNALAALAAFAGQLSDPGFNPGHWVEPPRREDGVLVAPHAALSEEANAFVAAAYKSGWIRLFDWGAWGHSPAGLAFFKNHAAIGQANADELSKILTATIRQDRFVEGALLAAFEDGLMAAVAARAAALLAGKA